MAHISEDRVLETSTTTGTGALTLAGAVTGYRAFSSIMAVADTCLYAVWGVDANGQPTGEWEGGVGTYSGVNTLTRTTVLESSNAGSVVTLSAGTKYVAITLLATKTGQFDNIGAMLLPAASAEPPTPATGNYLYAKEIVPGNTTLKSKRPSGVDSPIQDAIAFNRIQKFHASGTTLVAIGAAALTPSGTASASGIASSSAKNNINRVNWASATANNSIAGAYAAAVSTAPMFRGGVAGEGGFRVVIRFCLNALVAGNRGFIGVRDVVTAPTNIDPTTSTTPGVVGLAFALNTGNWKLVNNITGTAPTVLDLGANFPIDTTSLLELVLFCRPYTTTAGNIGYRVRRYTTSSADPAFETTGTLSTNIPAATTVLSPALWMTNNVTATAAQIQAAYITVESDW